MTARTLNLVYLIVLLVVLGAGVFLLYDDVYFWITGNRLREEVAGESNVKPDIPKITTEELAAMIEKNESFLLLDVRSPEEFEEGHIEQAANLPLAEIDNQIGKLTLAKNRPIVTMCDNEGCNRADQAATKLIGLGFENVRSYHDGIKAWQQSGHAVVTTTLDQDAFIQIFDDYETQEITVRDAWTKITKEGAIVIDVQKQENHQKEHLEGAIFVDLNTAGPKAKEGTIPREKTVIIYSEDGLRSKIATGAFIDAGYAKAYSMIGGIAEWKKIGNKVTTN